MQLCTEVSPAGRLLQLHDDAIYLTMLCLVQSTTDSAPADDNGAAKSAPTCCNTVYKQEPNTTRRLMHFQRNVGSALPGTLVHQNGVRGDGQARRR